MARLPEIDLNSCISQLLSVVQKAVDNHVTIAKPSQYAKRWWTDDLTKLRKDYTRLRNQAARLRREGHSFGPKLKEARTAKHVYFQSMRQQKRQHWEDFLADSTNIWQASKYLADGTSKATFSAIPKLQTATPELAQENGVIAQTLLDNFFPPLPDYPEPLSQGPYQQLNMTPISEEDVRRAIFASAPLKGPGIDRLPSLVWQKTGSATKHLLVPIFQSSMAQGFVPDEWKIAKIIPLKKPGKADYTNPESYRPISLLPTLSKAMEAVVAERISYLVEEHGLLPSNHFGGLKQRSTVDALVVLQEKIYQAWRDKKVLSLITFDVKGAFNGVATPVLLERLREKGIPEDLVRWIQAFC